MSAQIETLLGQFQLGHTSARFDFAAAKMKHANWKARLRGLLDGTVQMKESEAMSPRDCALGKWLYGNGLSRFGHIPAMNTLESTHSRMHDSVRAVLQAFHAGDKSAAEREFASVVSLGEKVVELLSQIEIQSGSPEERAMAAHG